MKLSTTFASFCILIAASSCWAQSSTRSYPVPQGSTTRGRVIQQTPVQQTPIYQTPTYQQAPSYQSPATSGSTTRQGSSTRTRMTSEQFQSAFWNYLTKSKSRYRKWKAFPGSTTEMYEGASPHGAYLRLFANSKARKNPQELPHGSIIVKENYGADQKTLMAVTVMYRSPGYDPAHNDWYWVKYLPNGKVAKTPPDKGSRPIVGRFQSCIDCHDGADGNDYTFAND